MNCLPTPDNLSADWILFESGAIAKHLDDRLTPYLHGLEPVDIKQPLGTFHAVRDDKQGTLELLISLNETLDEPRLEKFRLETAFERFWPDLEKTLSTILTSKPEVATERSLEDMVKELLETTRIMARHIQGLEIKGVEPPHMWRAMTHADFAEIAEHVPDLERTPWDFEKTAKVRRAVARVLHPKKPEIPQGDKE